MNCLVSDINGYDGFKTVKMSLEIIRGSPLTVTSFIPKAIQDYDIPIKYIFKKPHTTTFNCFNKKRYFKSAKATARYSRFQIFK